TLIGDSVNATARLESLCKVYKEPILISENTKSQINDQIKCDFIDNASVKGKAEQIPVFAPREYI
ncbi:MAG: adenylate/guanylate cyclase domain-containing protein, partial [Candidatus Margulisiibacteriota bacterium]|nr:adenylate/guanylate cyclase domain-containing protein [Candidatus Margulisiibacteriota bacterium]